MATTNIALAVRTRAKTGSTAAAAVRKAGKVPAVLFGHGSPPLAIEIDARPFDELLHAGGKNHLLEITLDGSLKDTALIREVQRDPITRRVVHADLQRVGATEEITASLPLITVGVAAGVKDAGGVMDVVLHAVEVTGPANALPASLEADVSGLGVHEHFTAGDLKLPAGIKLAVDAATILISIEPSRTEAAQAAAEGGPAAAEVPTVAESEAPAAAG
jgi:large subunit ribosomal protein L25